jgi:hypothetical protein
MLEAVALVRDLQHLLTQQGHLVLSLALRKTDGGPCGGFAVEHALV